MVNELGTYSQRELEWEHTEKGLPNGFVVNLGTDRLLAMKSVNDFGSLDVKSERVLFMFLSNAREASLALRVNDTFSVSILGGYS